MCETMKQRYGLVRRPWGIFYVKDKVTGEQTSLKTKDKGEAQRLLQARNEAHIQPALNLQIARAYLAGSDPEMRTRTWQHVMEVMGSTKHGPTLERWKIAMKDSAFDLIRNRPLLETRAEQLIQVLKTGTVSTNVFLRRLHNFAVDMNWIAWPIIPRRQWPAVVFKGKRGITAEEHGKIIAGERNAEWKAFYELLWNTGGAQSDIAGLRAEDIDWTRSMIAFARRKTGSIVQLHFGDDVAALLRSLPERGPLFPNIGAMNQSDRGIAFKRRCRLVGVSGVSLHCYRYAWAERALKCGYPERFAQQALGHNSKAVHHAYARHAEVTIPSLDEWEKKHNPVEPPQPPGPSVKVVVVDFRPQPGNENSAAPAGEVANAR
jgi:integrase